MRDWNQAGKQILTQNDSYMFEKTDVQFGRGACKLPDPGRDNLMNEG